MNICSVVLVCSALAGAYDAVSASGPNADIQMQTAPPTQDTGWLADYGQIEYQGPERVWRRGANVRITWCSPRHSKLISEDGYCLHIERADGHLDRVRRIRPTSRRLADWAQFSGKPMLVFNDALNRWVRADQQQ